MHLNSLPIRLLWNAESSINADVSVSEPGRKYLHATDGLGPVSFPSSYGEYADVQIGVICNYAPDDELDDNGNPTLHFQRDTNGNFYNVTMRNLFTTMQTMMTRSGFLPGVAMLFLLSTGRCDGYVHVDGSHIRLVGYQ